MPWRVPGNRSPNSNRAAVRRLHPHRARRRSSPRFAAQRSPGATLAIAAPYDQSFLATEVNEWALCAALIERDPVRWRGLEEALAAQALQAADDAGNPAPGLRPVIEEAAAFSRFEQLASRESQ